MRTSGAGADFESAWTADPARTDERHLVLTFQTAHLGSALEEIRMKARRDAGPLKTAEKFEMRLNRESGMSIRQCADWFNVSMATAMRALAEMREKFGPEKLPPRKRHLARWYIATSHNVTSQHD